jgi:two-component system, OmpR family, response regulator VicR
MKKVFILDDNEELLDIMDRILSPQFKVNVCNDRGSAMTKISKFMPDMIILDYFVGNNTADDIVQQLQESDLASSVPVVLFSASPEIEKVANRLGVAGFLEKPSSISKIRAYIENVFASSAQTN